MDKPSRVIGRSIAGMMIQGLSDTSREHVAVLLESAEIFAQRNKVRGDMWRTAAPPSDKFKMIEEKLGRARAAYDRIQLEENAKSMTDEVRSELIHEYEDSLLDLINFAVFAVRQFREGIRG